MSISKLLKNIMPFNRKKRLENEANRDVLLKNLTTLLKHDDQRSSLQLQSPRLCVAHNNFEKQDIKHNRVNLHDTYIGLDYKNEESKDCGHLIHFDQDGVIHLVKDGYVEFQKHDNEFSISPYEEMATKYVIDGAIEELKKITPISNLNSEDKSLEWLKVTLLTLKKSLDKIDHANTILSYKLYFGSWEESPILRLMIYNLDIKLTFTQEALELNVRNKENRQEFDSNAKLYQAKFQQLHNEVLNELINVFIKLKEVRNKPKA